MSPSKLTSLFLLLHDKLLYFLSRPYFLFQPKNIHITISRCSWDSLVCCYRRLPCSHRILCSVSVALTDLLAYVPAAHHKANILDLQAITIWMVPWVFALSLLFIGVNWGLRIPCAFIEKDSKPWPFVGDGLKVGYQVGAAGGWLVFISSTRGKLK